MAETEERSLDDFFAKRDKKKRKEKSSRGAAAASGASSAASNAAGAAASAGGTRQADGSGSGAAASNTGSAKTVTKVRPGGREGGGKSGAALRRGGGGGRVTASSAGPDCAFLPAGGAAATGPGERRRPAMRAPVAARPLARLPGWAWRRRAVAVGQALLLGGKPGALRPRRTAGLEPRLVSACAEESGASTRSAASVLPSPPQFLSRGEKGRTELGICVGCQQWAA